LVPKGSLGYVKRHALRHLRNIQHWRRVMGLPRDVPLRFELQSESRDVSEVANLAVTERMPQYGVWPRSESRVLKENIGYLRLSAMDDDAIGEIQRRMAEFRETEGLIVDVRDNGGGSREALRWFASYLMDEDDPPRIVNCAKYRLYAGFPEDHLASRFLYRAAAPEWTDAEGAAIAALQKSFRPGWEPPAAQFSDWHYMILNRLDHRGIYHYSKPVVVLMNAKCFSATDVFLASLKGWPRVTLLGTPSGGGSARAETYRVADTPIFVRLGSMVSFMPNGELFDAKGVQPDVIVEPEPDYFIGRSDKTLEAAEKLIRQQ
jgi:C-terminal processing protease CtpA/Prc